MAKDHPIVNALKKEKGKDAKQARRIKLAYRLYIGDPYIDKKSWKKIFKLI